MPIASIPMSRGKLVKDIKKPPMCAATINAIKSNTGPPGYAESPTIENNINQAITPGKSKIKKKKSKWKNFRKSHAIVFVFSHSLSSLPIIVMHHSLAN